METYPLIMSGKVEPGKQLGRTLGFPTANIKYKPSQGKYGFPQDGVYLAYAIVRNAQELNGSYPAIVNVGRHPTAPEGPPTIEAHLLGWPENEKIYNKRLDLIFITYFRPEQKFPSLDALREQLNKDREQALAYIRQHPDHFSDCKGVNEIIHE